MNAVVLTLLALSVFRSSAADIPKNHIGVGQTPKNEFVIYADPNVIGPDLPPEGTSSLFDSFLEYYWENNKVDTAVPYPLVELDRAVMSLGSGEGKVLGVLNPLTRGLSRPKSADKNFFATPRVLKAPDSGPKQSAKSLGINLKNRLYYAYSELTDSLEILSINAKAGRWEFQEVLDYKKGATPRLVYSDRSLCMSCHQNGGPIFVEETNNIWHETNDNPMIATLIAKSLSGDYDSSNLSDYSQANRPDPPRRFADLMYHGVKVMDPFSRTPRARALDYDTSTNISATFNFLQRIWVHRCGAGKRGDSCRRAVARVILTDIVFGRDRGSLQTSAHFQNISHSKETLSTRSFLIDEVVNSLEKPLDPLIDYSPNLRDRLEVERDILKIIERVELKKDPKIKKLRIGEPFEKWITAKSLAEAFQEFEILRKLRVWITRPEFLDTYNTIDFDSRLKNIRMGLFSPKKVESFGRKFNRLDPLYRLENQNFSGKSEASYYLSEQIGIPSEITTHVVDLAEAGVIRVLLNESLKQRLNPGNSDFRTQLLRVLGPEVSRIAEVYLLEYFEKNLDTDQLRQRALQIYTQSAPRLKEAPFAGQNLSFMPFYQDENDSDRAVFFEIDFKNITGFQSFLNHVFSIYVDSGNSPELNPRVPQLPIERDLSIGSLGQGLGFFNDYFTSQDIDLIKSKLPAVDSGDASAINKILDELSWSLTESIEQDVFQREVFMHDVLRGLRVRTEDLPARNDAYGVKIPKVLKIDAVASGDRFQIRDPGLKRVQTYCGACHSGQHKEIAFLDGDSEENIVKNLGSLKDKIIKYLENDADPMPPKRSDEHFELNGSVAEKSSLKAYILAL